MQNRPVRFGILGTARIAAKVAVAIREAANAELTLIGSRSAEKAAAWAREHGAAHSCGSYEAVLDDPDVDAVYVPLPPSLHAEWTIRAAEKKKHVLCEKPLAVSRGEARQMAAACREHGVQLMDGVMWIHHPRTGLMRAALDSGRLGRLRRVTAALSFCWDPVPLDDIRVNASLGGGALFDLGWYTAGVATWVFGALPERVWGTARWFQGVDMNCSATMWFADERMAGFDCGFDTVARRWFEAAGTTGSLVCDDFIRPWAGKKPRFWTHGSTGESDEHAAPDRLQETCMVEKFCELVQGGRPDSHWPSRAVETQVVCDALIRSARCGGPVDVPPVSAARPDEAGS